MQFCVKLGKLSRKKPFLGCLQQFPSKELQQRSKDDAALLKRETYHYTNGVGSSWGCVWLPSADPCHGKTKKTHWSHCFFGSPNAPHHIGSKLVTLPHNIYMFSKATAFPVILICFLPLRPHNCTIMQQIYAAIVFLNQRPSPTPSLYLLSWHKREDFCSSYEHNVS